MNKKEYIDKLVEETLHSADHIKRAAPMPFLLTRIRARLNKTKENVWEKLVGWVGRPVFAIPALATLILINVAVIGLNRAEPFSNVNETFQPQPDDFSFSGTTIYDIENTEQQ